MLRYDPPPLPAAAARALARLQSQVDAAPDHGARVALATQLFRRKSPPSAFAAVRSKLAAVSPAGEACFYCERDRYRDIEHVRPKRHYPGQAFAWTNYVYACVICNQDRKGDDFAVIAPNGEMLRFDRRLPPGQPPPAGVPALIDIRAEDPMVVLRLDFETGYFVPIGDPNENLRASFTRDVFDLNNDALARVRRQALDHMLIFVRRHGDAVRASDAAKAERIIVELRSLPQPTVLQELRRQRDGPYLAAWAADLVLLPESLWAR